MTEQNDQALALTTSTTGVEVDAQAPKTKSKLKILHEHPELSSYALDLLERHRLNRLPDKEVERNEELQAHYDYYAAIDPSHPAKPQPPYHLIPTPLGGLDAICRLLLGGRPQTDDRTVVDAYEAEFSRLRGIIYRLNSDVLRSENRYRVGQLLRVPYETIDVPVEE